ncbi:MAG: hypothetical protein IT368_17580 [Candidatus Hydrogenedentes bacterium]|nr:hypothetical protein [Candidatus Hydrogenedentota bacterium]
MNWNLAVLLIASLASGLALAQPGRTPPTDDATATEAPAGEDTAATDESTPEPAPVPVEGDVIHLKSGKVIGGAQVVRQGPTLLYVQVMPGVAPLELPLSQVESVDYDDKDPQQQRETASPSAPAAEPDYIEGKELSPELSKKLRASISDTPLSIQTEDYVEVLTRIAAEMNIPLTMGPKIKALTPKDRQWSAEVPAGTSFISLLYDHLLRTFPRVKETYEYGQIQLTLRRPEEPGPGPAPTLGGVDAPPAPAEAPIAPAPAPPGDAVPAPAPAPPPVPAP